jgi:hypothetical protein
VVRACAEAVAAPQRLVTLLPKKTTAVMTHKMSSAEATDRSARIQCGSRGCVPAPRHIAVVKSAVMDQDVGYRTNR